MYIVKLFTQRTGIKIIIMWYLIRPNYPYRIMVLFFVCLVSICLLVIKPYWATDYRSRREDAHSRHSRAVVRHDGNLDDVFIKIWSTTSGVRASSSSTDHSPLCPSCGAQTCPCAARAHTLDSDSTIAPHHFLALSLPLSAQLLISPQRRTSPAASSRMTHCAAAAPRSPKSSAAAPKIRTGSGGSPAAHVETGAHPHVVHPDRRPGCRPSRGGRRRGAHRSRGRGS